MRRFLALMAAISVVAAACGSSPASPGASQQTTSPTSPPTATTDPADPEGLGLIVRPGPDGRLPDDVLIGCRTGPYFPAAALESVAAVDSDEYQFVAAAIEPFLSSEEGVFWPQLGWQVLHESEDEVLVVHLEPGADPDNTAVSFMTVERRGDGWHWAGSSSGSDCELTTVVPAGLNRVEWRLDPDPVLGPANTVIHVFATELECASGQPMGDRLLGPEVVSTDEAVYLAFAAVPDGAEFHTCPSNPAVRVAVELTEPLGNRDIRDGTSVLGYLGDYLRAASS